MSKGQSAKRLKEIVRVFTYYGFDFLISSKLPNSKKVEPRPQALREALEELGATFVKIGQILSTRPDLLPKAYIEELEKLQDNNEITDFHKVKEIFYESFGTDINTYFLEFSETPLASASIAQVHRAKLIDGRDVVVKVQHYKIDEKMKLDLSILRRLSKLTSSHIANTLINPVEAFKEIEEATLKELDFEKEAKNTKRFRELNKNVACVGAPIIIDKLTSKKILTMEYIDGCKVTDFNILKEEGIDEKEIMEILKSKSRDNSRTPVQWNEEKNAGFTTGTPWINIANNYREINVERALENKDSVFYHYKKLIELRKNEDVIAYGDYIPLLEDHPKVYAYERNYNGEKLLVINNFYGEECLVDLSKEIEGLENYNKSILISNYKDSTLDLLNLKLRPYESIVYKLEK